MYRRLQRLCPHLKLEHGDAPHHGGRKYNCRQEEARTKEFAPIGKACREEYLDPIVERYARREEEEKHRLPCRHHPATIHLATRDVETDEHQAHRQIEMIGHHDGEDDESKGEE